MGVDKKDVGLVIHYDISGSLEDYIQEAGRAGRDPSMEADCFVLYNDNDLDNHFSMLNRSKLSINEIQQVWKAIKDMTGVRKHVCCSPLEIARQAGWDDSVREIETRVKTAISALENAGYVKRERNMPQVYATSISVNNMAEAVNRINAVSAVFRTPESRRETHHQFSDFQQVHKQGVGRRGGIESRLYGGYARNRKKRCDQCDQSHASGRFAKR